MAIAGRRGRRSLGLENRFDPKTAAALKAQGHRATLEQPWPLGDDPPL